jgi:prepilin-type N-terminal cleavage/methylation domain-containing protein
MDCRISAPPAPQTDRKQGYSLVEVIIAMGVLSSVLLSVITLFFMARRNVYSGKQMTHAISVGTRIMEDLSSMTVTNIYSNFNVASGDTLGTVTVAPTSLPDSSYDSSLLRTTTSVVSGSGCTGGTQVVFTNDTNSYLKRWYCQMMNTSNQLQDGSISIIITPRQPSPSGPVTPGNATTVRIRTIIRWQEAMRPRQVVMDTVKVRRPSV